MSLHFNVLKGSAWTIIIMSNTDTHPHLFISSTNLIKKNSQHTPQWRWPKNLENLEEKNCCQNYNYFISHLIDYLFDCSRTGSVGLAFQYVLLLTLYPVFESSVKFYPKIKQFHTPAISIHETWQVLTYFRGNGGH